jgi:hypothetical protein
MPTPVVEKVPYYPPLVPSISKTEAFRKIDEKLEMPVTTFFIIDPQTMNIVNTIETDKDNIGAMAIDRENDLLIAFNTGNDRFYKWKIKRDKDTGLPDGINFIADYANPLETRYQDCTGGFNERIICGGYTSKYGGAEHLIRKINPLINFQGYIDVFDTSGDFSDYFLRIRIPAALVTGTQGVLTYNPFWISDDTDYLFFMPDDDKKSRLIVYGHVTTSR